MRVAIYQIPNWVDYESIKLEKRSTAESHGVLHVPYAPIAIVDGTDLGDIYRTVEYRDTSSLKNDGITVIFRSTCVGDIFYDVETKIAYVVEWAGFSEYKGNCKFHWFHR